MQLVALILSGLAFVAAFMALFLTLQEKKHTAKRFDGFSKNSQKHRTAMIQYVDRTVGDTADRLIKEFLERCGGVALKVDAVKQSQDSINSKLVAVTKALKAVNGKVKQVSETVSKNSDRLQDLEDGCVPNFEEAMRAVNAVNDMNSGISNIFGFDPMEALKKSRTEAE